jgi:hypothetical protein
MATYLSMAELIGGLKVEDQGLFYGLVANDPILERQVWKLAPSGEYKFTQLDSLPAATFRNLNTTGSSKFPNPLRKSGSCKVLSYQFAVDYQNLLRSDKDEMKENAAIALAAARSTLLYYYFNGDAQSADSAQFDGVKKLATLHGHTVTMSANGAALTVAKLQEAIAAARKAGGNDNSRMDIYMNPYVQRKLWTLLANTSGTSGMRWDYSEAGNAIKTFDGIPISVVDTDAAGNVILPFTETCGNQSLSASLYVITRAQGDGGNGGLFMATTGAPTFREVPTTIGATVAMDWGVGMDLSHTYGVVRLEGILES